MSKVDLRDLVLAVMLYRGGAVMHEPGYMTCRDADSLGRKICTAYGDVDFVVDELAAEGLVTRERETTARPVEMLYLTEAGMRAARAAARRLGRRGRDVARYAAMESYISKIVELLEKRKVVEKRGDYYKTGLF
jgi:DNA-binding MarR family transcriptional regulator